MSVYSLVWFLVVSREVTNMWFENAVLKIKNQLWLFYCKYKEQNETLDSLNSLSLHKIKE